MNQKIDVPDSSSPRPETPQKKRPLRSLETRTEKKMKPFSPFFISFLKLIDQNTRINRTQMKKLIERERREMRMEIVSLGKLGI